MNKIRILEVIAGFSIEYPLGGIERFVIELVQYFNKAEFDITVAGLWMFEDTYRQKWLDILHKKGVNTVELSPWVSQRPLRSFFVSLFGLIKQLSSHPVNIYHSHDQFGDIMGLVLKMFHRNLILVRTVQNNFEWHRRPLRKIFFSNLLIPLTYEVEIGVNKSIVNKLNSRWISKMKRKESFYIPNASNIINFKDIDIDVRKKKESLGIDNFYPIIGSVGRMHHQKGFDILLKAFAVIHHDFPNALLVIVGDGPLRGTLMKQSEELGIQKSIALLGTRSDIPEILKTFEIFVSSSRWEGLPGVILEAMATGIPIVATNIPGTNEIIENNKNGLLVEPENSISLAEGIRKLLISEEDRSVFIAESLNKVKNFSVENICHEYENVYKGIINK